MLYSLYVMNTRVLLIELFFEKKIKISFSIKFRKKLSERNTSHILQN